MEPNTPRQEPSDSPKFTKLLERWQTLFVVLAAVLTGLANVVAILEKQWSLLIAPALLGVMALAILSLLARRRGSRLAGGLLRPGLHQNWAIAILVGVPVISLLSFFCYVFLPRINEDGTRIAVARFAGPDLPKPYESCRPSDMLVDRLEDVTDEYGHLHAFELPYVIDPNGRWAQALAKVHGFFESADVVVYGEYTLVKSDRAPAKGWDVAGNDADMLYVSPSVDSVPNVPLGEFDAPLASWELPSRKIDIDELCSGKPAEFFPNASRRLALALVAEQLLASEDYFGARKALAEAKNSNAGLVCLKPSHGDDEDDACSGVLAFYLANVDQRLGNSRDAEHEYAVAGWKLNRAAPFINLGELEWQRGKFGLAFEAFDRALRIEPASVTALAARAAHEAQVPERRRFAALDLHDALGLGVTDASEALHVAAAIHAWQSGVPGSGRAPADCAYRRYYAAQGFHDFKERSSWATVRFGSWLASDRKWNAAIAEFYEALKFAPHSIAANYALGDALRRSSAIDPNPPEVYFTRALAATPRTAEQLLYQARAARDLREPDLAESLYREAILKNARSGAARAQVSVDAYHELALLHETQVGLAARDFAEALKLRSPDPQRPGDVTLPPDAGLVRDIADFESSSRSHGAADPIHTRYAALRTETPRSTPPDQFAFTASCAFEPITERARGSADRARGAGEQAFLNPGER